MQKPSKCVLFDRDGTLIIDKIYLNDPDAIEYLPGASAALLALQNAGYAFAVVTNQSGVPRGLVQMENLHEIHRRIAARFAADGIEIAGFYFAPYSVESDHPMRKPNTGMLTAAANDHGFDLARGWVVGDRMTDIEAGRRAGMSTALILGTGGPTPDPDDGKYAAPTIVGHSLGEIARLIMDTDASR